MDGLRQNVVTMTTFRTRLRIGVRNHAFATVATIRNHDPMIARLRKIYQGLSRGFCRRRNHGWPSAATVATVCLYTVAMVAGGKILKGENNDYA